MIHTFNYFANFKEVSTFRFGPKGGGPFSTLQRSLSTKVGRTKHRIIIDTEHYSKGLYHTKPSYISGDKQEIIK